MATIEVWSRNYFQIQMKALPHACMRVTCVLRVRLVDQIHAMRFRKAALSHCVSSTKSFQVINIADPERLLAINSKWERSSKYIVIHVDSSQSSHTAASRCHVWDITCKLDSIDLTVVVAWTLPPTGFGGNISFVSAKADKQGGICLKMLL